jgi:hypothetical protein
MDWRCEWCGKPHAENDPPCDNCGHGTFERAVVPVADDGEGVGSKSTVWVCTECGREHTKHTPPCSRCGNEELVRQRQEVDDEELVAPGYLDLVTPRYVLALVGVLAVAAVFVLGLAGVISVPGFGNSVPGVANVPGNATAADTVSLSDVEAGYLGALNDRRGGDAAALSRNDRLDEVAAFVNQRVVKSRYGDGQLPSRERIGELIGGSCERGATLSTGSVRPGPDATAGDITTALIEEGGISTDVRPEATRIGIDTHTAPDGTVYLTQIIC